MAGEEHQSKKMRQKLLYQVPTAPTLRSLSEELGHSSARHSHHRAFVIWTKANVIAGMYLETDLSLKVWGTVCPPLLHFLLLCSQGLCVNWSCCDLWCPWWNSHELSRLASVKGAREPLGARRWPRICPPHPNSVPSYSINQGQISVFMSCGPTLTCYSAADSTTLIVPE